MFELPPLPFEKSALEPHMSERTLSFHYDKHHAGYVKKLNNALEGDKRLDWKLEEVIHDAAKNDDIDVFRNAAQIWNHTFFWNSLSADGGGGASGKLAEAIEKDFGSMDAFREAFADAATGEFGSGWAWLVLDNGKLRAMSTTDAGTPISRGLHPLLCCDVWEHAYYLDYQNDRGKFVETFLDHLVNWEFANANFENQGEGNQIGARTYNENQEAFAKSGKVEGAAEEARKSLDD